MGDLLCVMLEGNNSLSYEMRITDQKCSTLSGDVMTSALRTPENVNS